jgi:hypothetical protein
VPSGATRPFAVGESGGVWDAGAQAVPVDSRIAGNLPIHLQAVACPAADPCVTVGEVTSGAGQAVPIAAAARAGVFGPLGVVAPPPNRRAVDNGLASVACSASGACAAVGTSSADAGLANPGPSYGLAVTGSNGTWSPTSLIARMPDAATRDLTQLHRVACGGSGSCMAIGGYVSTAQRSESMAVGESGGTWGPPTLITAPPHTADRAGGSAAVDLLACPGSGPCVAVGSYGNDDGTPHLMSAGSTPTPVAPPPTSPPAATVRLVSSTIATRAGGRATIRLACKGSASCAGRLRLTARRPATRTRRAGKASVVARKAFMIEPGRTARVAIRLNARGRALLRAAHAHLTATLTVLATSPAPSKARTQHVRLTKPRR